MLSQVDLDRIADRYSFGLFTQRDEVRFILQRYLNFYGPNVADHREDKDIQTFLDFYEQLMPLYRLPFRNEFRERTGALLREFNAKLPELLQQFGFESSMVQYRLAGQWSQYVLTHDELDKLFAILDRPDRLLERIVIGLILGSACDISEMPEIQLGDVDLFDGKILIRANHTRYHYVPVGPGLRMDILKYLTEGRIETSPRAWLFVDQGEKYGANNVHGILQRTILEAGIPIEINGTNLIFTYDDEYLRLGGNTSRHVEAFGEQVTPGEEAPPPHPRVAELISLNEFVYQRAV